MTDYKFGDIVVLQFPFTDGKNTKKRPALVLYHDKNDKELLLARITSKIYTTKFDIEINNWKESGLLLKSCARLIKIATLHTDLVYLKLGELSENDKNKVSQKIKKQILKSASVARML